MQDNNPVFLVQVPTKYFEERISKYKTFLENVAKKKGFHSTDIVLNKTMNVQKKEKTKETQVKKSKQKSNTAQELPEIKKTTKPEFTFKNFITGPTNDFAASVAFAVANNVGTAHNPCLIYGPVGLGKTHLLKAIGHEIRKQDARAKVLYLTSEQLLNEFTDAIRNKKMAEFQHRTRKQDVILIDDIQFFSGKEGFQEEMFHIFNVLSNEEKQMVFASDRAISKIKDLQDRLASRFQSGISADLAPPTKEMAISIMENYLDATKRTGLAPKEQLYFIAEHVRSNTRDMLAFLTRVVEYKKMTKKEVSLDTLKRWMQEFKPKKHNSDANKILRITAQHFTFSIDELKGNKRTRNIAQARHVAMFLMRKHGNMSFTEVGKFFNVSHVTSNKAYTNMEESLGIGADVTIDIETIESKLTT